MKSASSFFGSLFGSVKTYFSKRRAIAKTMDLLAEFGVTPIHIKQAMDEIIELKDAEMRGSEKTAEVVTRITALHTDALGTPEGVRWQHEALQMLTQVVQLVFLIARLLGKV